MASIAISENFVAICSRNRVIVTSLSGRICLKYDVCSNKCESSMDSKGADKTTDMNQCQSKEDDYVVDCTFSPTEKYFAICTSSKKLLVWGTVTWALTFTRNIPRRPMKLLFGKNGDVPVIADKAGDVYRMSLENDTNEHLIGHLSVILDMVITSDDKRIITTDRDGKIRISFYPNCYNVDKFLMGHNSFVSSIALDQSEKFLLSVDGDGNLFLWNISLGHYSDVVKLPIEGGAVPRRVCVSDQMRIFVIINGIKKIFHYEIKGEKLKENDGILLSHAPLDIRCKENDVLVLQHSKEEPLVAYNIGLDSKLSERKLASVSEIQEFLEEPLILEPWKCQSWADDQL